MSATPILAPSPGSDAAPMGVLGRLSPLGLASVAFGLGILLRWPGLPYATADAHDFLLPWYDFALKHGFSGLREAFTNYAPAYTYLVILLTKLDGLAPPLALIKAVSFAFELGSSVLAARLAACLDPRPIQPTLTFALVWLAPSVIHNGAFWGQAESLWTFFVLLCLLALCRNRPVLAVAAFALAFSVKAQAMFLAPLGLALVLNGTIRWRWLLLVPAIYLLIASPALLFGRPVADIVLVYGGQAARFPALTMNAANLYIFLPPRFHAGGLPAALAASAVIALGFAVWLSRAGKLTPDRLLLAAAVSLFLMPFVLPKMHERYFYAYEIVILILAVARPTFAGAAAIAQVSSTLTYLAFDGFGGLGIPIAALTNLAVCAFLLHRLHLAVLGRDPFGETGALDRAVLSLWLAYLAQIVLLVAAGSIVDAESVWPLAFWDWRGIAAFPAILAFVVLARRALGVSRDARRTPNVPLGPPDDAPGRSRHRARTR